MFIRINPYLCHLLTRYQSTIFPNHKSCVRKKGVPKSYISFNMKKVDIANRMVLDFVASNLSEDEIFEIKAAQMYRNLSFSKKYASLNESYMAMPMPMYGVGNM